MNNRPLHWPGFLHILLATACWGAGTVVAKRALNDIAPLTLTAMMLIVSATLLWLVVYLQRLPVKLGPEPWRLAVLGLLSPGLNMTLAVGGLRLISASEAVLIQALQPVLLIGLAWLLLRERPRSALIGLSLATIAGVLLVTGFGSDDAGGSWLGRGLLAAAVACASIPLVHNRRYLRAVEPLVLLAVQQTMGMAWAIAVLTVAPVGGTSPLAALGSLSAWGWAAATGITYFAVGYWLYFSGLKHVPASTAAPLLSLIPVFGVAGGVLFLAERLLPAQWAGASIVIGAVLLIGLQQSRLRPAALAVQPRE
jgi:drug/metabolite transporter (DMT)-like permease